MAAIALPSFALAQGDPQQDPADEELGEEGFAEDAPVPAAKEDSGEGEVEVEDDIYYGRSTYGDSDDGQYESDRRRGRDVEFEPEDGGRESGGRRRHGGDRDHGDRKADAGPGADAFDNDRILMGGLVTGLTVRFFPIALLDYILGPFAGQWAVNEFTDAPVTYRTSSKLAAAGAMFLFDVVSFGAVGAVSGIIFLIASYMAPFLSGLCFLCSFGACSLIPLLGVGFVGMYAMEWLDADYIQPASSATEERAPSRRRRRRRRAESGVPRAPRVAQVMSY